MSLIARWAIKICPDCGAQVFGGGLCRQHHPPGHPVETMVARVSDVVVLEAQFAGAVGVLAEALAVLTDPERPDRAARNRAVAIIEAHSDPAGGQ